MAFGLNTRISVFIFFSAAFYFILSGLLTAFVAVPVTILLISMLHFQHCDQVPKERLHRFSKLFGLSHATTSDSAIIDSKERLSRIVLHRGGCIDCPENTLEAIREAAKQGVAGVEIDLQFTCDGVGILLHDDTLDRTTNGTGDVRKKTFAELNNVDAAAKHDRSNSPAKIPTLEECLTECLRLNLLVFIDCKAFADKTAKLVDELFEKYPELYDTAVVCSFFPQIIHAVRKKNRRVITALTYRYKALSCEQDCLTPRFAGFEHFYMTCLDYLSVWVIYAWSWWLCGNSFLLLNKEGLSRNILNWWKQLGIHVLVWTVNSKAEKEFCLNHLGVPIITDGLQSKS